MLYKIGFLRRQKSSKNGRPIEDIIINAIREKKRPNQVIYQKRKGLQKEQLIWDRLRNIGIPGIMPQMRSSASTKDKIFGIFF